MAEIPVEKKSSLAWLWLLLALLLIGLLLWWVLGDDDAEVDAIAPVAGVEAGLEPEGPIEAVPPGALPEPVAQGPMTISDILGNPVAFIGRNDFEAASVEVPAVPTDRGFWIEDQGQRLFAIIIDNPQEVPKDINPGQRLRITEGMLRDATAIGGLPGEPIDPDTKRILDGVPVFLVVDEADIEILSRPGG